METTLPNHRRYAIIGTGAIGGFYGARLQRAGLEVHFLLHTDYATVCRSGLVIDSVEGHFTLPQVNAYQDIHQIPCCDVVIVSLKTTQNHLLPQLLPPILQESGVVLILQNGLGMEEAVAKIVGEQRVMGGICFICSHKVGPGHICHLDYGSITMGEYLPHGITARLSQIAADFNQAGIAVQMTEDLLLARWQKLVWNIPFNGLSVVLNATTAELLNQADSRYLVKQLMDEVKTAATSCDRRIVENFIEQMLINTEKIKPYKPSMKLDYEAHRPLEIEAIFAQPLHLATGAGIKLPLIMMLYRQLQFLDTQNRFKPTS